jgi:hypothetical protein
MAGSHTLMEITGTSSSLYDRIVGVGSGGLTFGGNLDLVMSGSRADQTTFHLFSNFASYTGDFAAVGLGATGEYAGLTFSEVGCVWTSTETANNQRLVFTTATGDLVVVPEPSTYALMAVGAGIVGLMHRRKRWVATASVAARGGGRHSIRHPTGAWHRGIRPAAPPGFLLASVVAFPGRPPAGAYWRRCVQVGLSGCWCWWVGLGCRPARTGLAGVVGSCGCCGHIRGISVKVGWKPRPAKAADRPVAARLGKVLGC